jgi:hypothetical protein
MHSECIGYKLTLSCNSLSPTACPLANLSEFCLVNTLDMRAKVAGMTENSLQKLEYITNALGMHLYLFAEFNLLQLITNIVTAPEFPQANLNFIGLL